MKLHFHESVKRSFTKAITFRTIILVSDAIIIFAITKRYDFTLGVMLFSNIASTLLYLFHERMWDGITWGRQKEQKHT
jgi:uncharacterized membrane protein